MYYLICYILIYHQSLLSDELIMHVWKINFISHVLLIITVVIIDIILTCIIK